MAKIDTLHCTVAIMKFTHQQDRDHKYKAVRVVYDKLHEFGSHHYVNALTRFSGLDNCKEVYNSECA